MMRNLLAFALSSFLIAGLSPTNGAPPSLVNYQGVLRDASDKPLSGTYDLLFRFMDAATGGNEIMVDQHAAVTSNAITVSGGLFNVALGSGTVTDGSGPGTYAALDSVFRDYGAVWLEVNVGGETLSPRTRVQSVAYALNATSATDASQLNGQPASNFIDTSATQQTKSGRLSVSINEPYGFALSAQNLNDVNGKGVSGVGWSAGAWGFAVGDNGDGVVGLAGGYGSAGGYFDSQTGSYSFGVFGRGWEGGHFEQRDSSGGLTGVTADLAYSNTAVTANSANAGGIGIFATGEVDGVWAQATGSATAGATGGMFVSNGAGGIGVSGMGVTGGRFSSTTTPGLLVKVADSGMGVNAVGGNPAGSFQTTAASSTGVSASGAQTGVDGTGGGYGGFFHANNSGSVGVYAVGVDTGVSATGQSRGGYFANAGVERASLATSGLGISASGSSAGAYFSDGSPWFSYTYIPYQGDGIYAYGQAAGGEFHNFSSGSYAYVGYSSYKIQGSGAVSFVQNHPSDPSKVIVYAAPEGDEVAVYTRGSGRLVDGEAKVALGPTFALVANPDIGLTATATPTSDLVPLMVVAKSTRELTVRGPAGSNAAFDYAVWGLRVGFEEQSIVQPKQQDSKIPSMHQHEQFFAEEPALRDYTAFARFKAAEANTFGRKTFDFSRADQLRDAVGVVAYREPNADMQSAVDRPTPAAGTPVAGQPSGPTQPSAAPPPMTMAGMACVPTAPTAQLLEFEVVEPIDPGDVLALDPLQPGMLRRASSPSDPNVAGIAERASADADGVEKVSVVTTNYATVRVDAQFGAIHPGDLLVASATPGHAMVAKAALPGTVIGKALQSLESGTGVIRVLIMLR